ncbi:MAG: DUF1513 domain-containing protein [Planctomycetes bacterium]|nr:DUF1513 domain-containing protein [Planctomycetota bacterium]
MDQHRRNFLYAASASGALALLAACSNRGTNNAPGNTQANAPSGNDSPDPKPEPATLETGNLGTLIGTGFRGKDGGLETWLGLVDLNQTPKFVTGELKPVLIPMTFFGHAVIPHPIERTRVAVFAKWGPGGCEVDLGEKRVIRDIQATPGREFYGHGAWSKDGQTLYAVESEPRSQGAYAGYVVVRDAADMKVLGEFPTFGKMPHDCHILDEGKTLAITNGGGTGDDEEGCVTFVDIETRTLLERVPIPVYMAGHLAITGRSSKGDLAVGSTPHNPPGPDPDAFKKIPGALTLRPSGSAATKVGEPAAVTENMLGETLSLAIHEELNIVGATNPAGDICTFWDIKTGAFLNSFEMKEACGIALTLDKRYFVVTARHKYAVQIIRARDLALVEDASFTLSGVNGSHCLIYDL